ncbi:chitinase-3-like protein 2 isoform X2 [Babylonia areolata]|uniref:chitinase-3-like protein 2 isoform X2 n=1 Tax=Babylonia areolata TaxID=304850 RepID=UPI003FD56B9B
MFGVCQSFIRFCYFVNWANRRPSPLNRFDVEHIDPSLCTHLVYAFAGVDADAGRIVPLYPADEDPSPGNRGRYKRFNDLKKTNKHLKTILSIGGEYAGSEQFIAISRDHSTLQTFTQTTVEFLQKRDFDGLDIDWEYPNATTKTSFSDILQALHTAFEANRVNGKRLILTAALPVGREKIQGGYDITALSKYLDLANLMTYDYHGGWSTITGFDSPLFSRTSNRQFNQELSTEWTVHYYISKGLPASKILVGVTAAGARFKLEHTNLTGVGAPVIQSPSPRLSPLWELPDRYAYPEICQILENPNSVRVFDEEQQVPYMYLNDDWCGYDDVQSVKRKREWMVKMGVAGAMFWALDMDDFTGKVCGLGKYPLLHALSPTEDNGNGGGGTSPVNPGEATQVNPGSAANCVPAAAGPWGLCLAVIFFVSVWFARFF